jgi:hypothetical protein
LVQALVECEGESIDLSGEMGAVGRPVIPDTPTGDSEMHLDLKGIFCFVRMILVGFFKYFPSNRTRRELNHFLVAECIRFSEIKGFFPFRIIMHNFPDFAHSNHVDVAITKLH